MKKSLFFLAVAAVALASCSSDDTIAENSNVGKNQQKEIAFFPVATPTTRAAVSGTSFLTTDNFQVAAYMVEPVGQAGNYFAPTVFNYNSTSTLWEGETKRYWPLSACYINFLGVANVEGTATFNSTTPTSACVVGMTDNSTAQKDLMYAIGNGQVTQSDNSLTIPTSVSMQFIHAQAWVKFNVKAATSTETAITVNNITLTGAKYAGTYTITHTNYDKTASQSVAGAWSSLGDAQNVTINHGSTLTTGGADVANGLMIVPDGTSAGDFTSFTINYTLDGKSYNYTYTPASTNVEQAHSYTYTITFTLKEIKVAATVNNWTDTNTAVAIPPTA